jgi:predicted dehydrogenase
LRGALVYSETSRHRVLAQPAARRELAVFVEKPLAMSEADVAPDPDAALDSPGLRGAHVYSETSRHRVLAQPAARRELAVFVEKPLAMSETDARAMFAGLVGGGPFSTGFFLRYADTFRRLRDTVSSGELEAISHAAVSVAHEGPARGWFDGEYAWMRQPAEGGGGFFDLIVHCLDLTAWVLGPIDRVLAVRLQRSGHHGVAVVRTASGTVVDLEAGWEASAPALRMSVTGATTTVTASRGQLLADSTVILTGRNPMPPTPPVPGSTRSPATPTNRS